MYLWQVDWNKLTYSAANRGSRSHWNIERCYGGFPDRGVEFGIRPLSWIGRQIYSVWGYPWAREQNAGVFKRGRTPEGMYCSAALIRFIAMAFAGCREKNGPAGLRRQVVLHNVVIGRNELNVSRTQTNGTRQDQRLTLPWLLRR